MLYIDDHVLEMIKREIGDLPPERGGALLGEPGRPMITKFIFDPLAYTTRSTYMPSRRLNQLVRQAEKEEGLEYKGIIHSHPGGYDHPSSQDLRELRTGLNLNKHMPYYLVPIVTELRESCTNDHEVASGKMKVSFYAGFRQEQQEEDSFPRSVNSLHLFRQPEVQLKKMKVHVIPKDRFTRDLEVLTKSMIGVKNPQTYTVDQDDEPMMAGSIEVEGLLDLLIVTDLTYPRSNPSILITFKNGDQEQHNPPWKVEDSFANQLEDFITTVIDHSIGKRNTNKDRRKITRQTETVEIGINIRSQKVKDATLDQEVDFRKKGEEKVAGEDVRSTHNKVSNPEDINQFAVSRTLLISQKIESIEED